MPYLIDLPSCETVVSNGCETAIQKQIGINRSKLTFKDQKVVLEDCTKCEKRFRVQDNGLYEDNVALFWRFCQNAIHTEYCAGENPIHDNRVSQPFRFCYNDSVVPDI